MAVKAHWKGEKDGNGHPVEFHSGIPARDLTDDDWDSLSEEERDTVLASPLYNVVGVPDTSESEREKHRARLERRVERTAETAGEGESN